MVEPISNKVSWGRNVVKSSPDFFIIDNFLNPIHFKKFQSSIESMTQPWSFLDSVSSRDDYLTTGKKTSYGFNFIFCLDDTYIEIKNSAYVGALNEQVKKYFCLPDSTQIHRSNAFMTTYRGEELTTFTPHVDTFLEHYTSIFYLHSTNAPTILYNEEHYDSTPFNGKTTIKEKVDSIENRLLFFRGNILHSGTCATDSPFRIVINTNYLI